MRVLAITGDKSFKQGHSRFDLQASVVEDFRSLYVGPGSLWPKLPEGKFDVVTSQDPFFRGLFAWFISNKLNIKLNIQLHADLEQQNFLKKIIAPFVFRRADSIRVVSEKLKKQVEKLGVRNSIFILPVYIDLTQFTSLVRTPSEQSTVLWVGRFEDEKDPILAIEVFKKIVKEIPEVKFIMLGAGSLEEEVKKLATDMFVEFPGWQNPIPYFESARVVLSTSKAESWGASIVEALAAGVSVVSPDVGVAKEAGAFVVERGELANKVIEVLKTKPEGKLNDSFKLLDKEEWLNKWKETLV